jgi:YD repeat-containing protein
MKTINAPTTIAFLLLTIVPFQACKKDSKQKPACRVITTTSTSGSYNYIYNSEGKLASITNGTKVSTFVYSPNSIVINATNSGSFYFKRTVTLNSNGLPSNMKWEKNVSGTEWENTLYEYSGMQLIKTTTTKSTGGAPYIETYEWANGNMVANHFSGGTTTYQYYPDKTALDGDFFHHIQLANYGYFFLKPKNMVKSFTTVAYTATIEYGNDDDNKINIMTVTYGYPTPQIATFNYQYQCN